MSTRASIGLKVTKETVKELQNNLLEDLYNLYQEPFYLLTEVVYNGNMAYTGVILEGFYKDSDKILDLILSGCINTVQPTIEASRKNPIVEQSSFVVKKLTNKGYLFGVSSFIYIWDKKKWKVYEMGSNRCKFNFKAPKDLNTLIPKKATLSMPCVKQSEQYKESSVSVRKEWLFTIPSIPNLPFDKHDMCYTVLKWGHSYRDAGCGKTTIFYLENNYKHGNDNVSELQVRDFITWFQDVYLLCYGCPVCFPLNKWQTKAVNAYALNLIGRGKRNKTKLSNVERLVIGKMKAMNNEFYDDNDRYWFSKNTEKEWVANDLTDFIEWFLSAGWHAGYELNTWQDKFKETYVREFA